MLLRKAQNKKRSTNTSTVSALDSSLTSIEWLPNMHIGENSSSLTTPPPIKQTLPVTTNIQQKIEATEIEAPTTTTVNDGIHVK
jgi:hypothetical protein